MADVFSKSERSKIMQDVKSSRNSSTRENLSSILPNGILLNGDSTIMLKGILTFFLTRT